jgi:MoxR-like ATPase
LLGHHNPSRVLREDYSADNFVPGPLVAAMTEGGFLYIEEFNRAPEDTLNTLLMAIADRRVVIPRVGVITAAPTFRLVASMNPFDNVGTMRISTSVHDRLCRLAVGYQDGEAERGIVRLRTGVAEGDDLGARLVHHAVEATRATRHHEFVRQGSSVRGAIDLVLVAAELAPLRGVTAVDDEGYPQVLLDAMIVALSGRMQLDEIAETTPEAVLREIWEDILVLGPAQAAPG